MDLLSILKSSDGSGKLSARANSFLLGILPIVVLIAPLLGFNITEGEEGVALVVKLIAAVEGVAAVIWHIKGWADRSFRKVNRLGVFSGK